MGDIVALPKVIYASYPLAARIVGPVITCNRVLVGVKSWSKCCQFMATAEVDIDTRTVGLT